MNREQEQCIRNVLHYIPEHLHEKLTIDALCAVAAMSRTVFLRNFKALTGTTAGRYVMEFRLKKASLLMASGEKSLRQIAGETGFYDKAHLFHAFQKYFGTSPQEYIKSIKRL